MVVEVARGGTEEGLRNSVFVESGVAKTRVGGLVVVLEIQAVFDQQRASKCVVADTVAAHPRIEERQREKKQEEKPVLRFAPTRGV